MALENGVHLRRDRAESFGAIAADYDRFRPSYPAPLIDDLVALRPGSVLDAGCGTGKAATLLAARGLDMLGVEPDPAMAAAARAHGIHVEVGHFETWPDAGRRFDLITCAQAWHWIDPAIGPGRAAQLLRPGGALALFWNYDHDAGAAQPLIDAVYAQFAPELTDSIGNGTPGRDTRPYAADLRSVGGFADVGTRTYAWTRTDTVDAWVGQAVTHSDHLALAPDRRARLVDALHSALGERGDRIEVSGATFAVVAHAESG